MTRHKDDILVHWQLNGEQKHASVRTILEAEDLLHGLPSGASHMELEYWLRSGYHMHLGTDDFRIWHELGLMRWTTDGKLVRRKERAK